VNKAEFIEAYGHRYSRCNIVQEHNEHLWETLVQGDYQPTGPYKELWWCSGERIDFEEFTGFKRAVSKNDPEPVRDELLESVKALDEQRQNKETIEELRAELNRRHKSREALEDLKSQARERGETWLKVGEAVHAAFDPATGRSEVFKVPDDPYETYDFHRRYARIQRTGEDPGPLARERCSTPQEHPAHPILDESGPKLDIKAFCDGTELRPDAVSKKGVDAREHLAKEFPETELQAMTGIEAAEAVRSENRSLPVRWADRAMFKAEPMPEGGPRVYLLWMTPDPLGAIAAACKMYKGEVVRDLSAVTDAERLEYLAQVQKTKLKAPFEFVKFHFLIEGVTRSFTHQMVRQRTAVYAQESLRFAVKGGEEQSLPVGLPPSLAGTDDWASAEFQSDITMTKEERMRQAWEDTVAYLDEQYSHLINLGMPAEDARGLLPHNTLTRLHYSTDLRALLDHAGNRLCTQAQVEWRLVFAKIVEVIRNVDINPNDTEGHNVLESNGLSRVYMANKLAEMFKPVCYQTGKCEFLANFDRYCSIRERVTEHARKGEPSETWDDIRPGEWLLDPNSAREPNR
jgi:flavin-dependent thymidylate synthase